jgi:hypothetical protein
MGGASSSAASSRTQTSAVANTAGNPTKYMFVTSRPSTPVQVFVTHKNESSDVIKKNSFVNKGCRSSNHSGRQISFRTGK